MTPLRRHGTRPPVRMAHLGLGAFHRAHQAWWTDAAGGWGIAAFAGRRPDVARSLRRQGGVYTLVERGPSTDRMGVVSSVVETAEAGEVGKWLAVMASPATALVTLTVTEAAYRLTGAGKLDVHAADVAADLAALRSGRDQVLCSVAGRLVAGLAARRRAGGAPVAVVSCDNIPDNGHATRTIVCDAAAHLDAGLARWIATEVSFVSTVVDRITPATTPDDVALVASSTGLFDAVPVVTEPWREWVLAGAWPAGRPAWEGSGALFVDDVGSWAERKLRLLNGGHSLLAYLGLARGHTTVAEAAGDLGCRAWLDAWWAEAAVTLTIDRETAAGYCASLVARFDNGRLAHRLDQIAIDGGTKLALRVGPVLASRARRGLDSPVALQTIAAWMRWMRSPAGAPDPHAALVSGDGSAGARAVLAAIAPGSADDPAVIAALATAASGPAPDATSVPAGLLGV